MTTDDKALYKLLNKLIDLGETSFTDMLPAFNKFPKGAYQRVRGEAIKDGFIDVKDVPTGDYRFKKVMSITQKGRDEVKRRGWTQQATA